MDHEQLERAFLEEMEALESFRIAYTAQFPKAPLSHDDPDVRRLLEALAFFTARTRLASQRGLDESVQRIFRQHFPFLLAPTPAMAMLKARPADSFADASDLPAGSLVALHERPGSGGAAGRRYFFRTLAPLRVLPLHVRAVDVIDRAGGGLRMLLRLSANAPSNQPLESVALHVNHLDDLASSVTVLQELRTHVRGASVLYGAQAREDAPGERVDVAFGPAAHADAVPDPYMHPLQLARLQLRFPRSDLYVRFSGLRPPRAWQHLTLCLDLDDEWPRKLRLTADGFELHTVPMINVRRELASPIEVDGTRDRYLLQHPDPAAGYVPLWVVAAQRPTKRGFVPLEPAVFGGTGEAYEAWAEGRGASRRGYASFRLAGAYDAPERISIDAFWHQPALASVDPTTLKVALHERYVDGVAWDLSGPFVPSADSWVDGNREAQLQLVSMKTMRDLGRAELSLLLAACGANVEPLYAKLFAALRDVTIESAPQGRRAGSLKRTYVLGFRGLETSDLPRLALFCEWIAGLLGSWNVDEPLDVVASVPNLDVQLRTRSGKSS